MTGTLHHMAVNSGNFEETVKFFQELFDMEVLKTNGEAPIGSCGSSRAFRSTRFRKRTLAKARAMGCKAMDGKPAHWFLTPEGIVSSRVSSARRNCCSSLSSTGKRSSPLMGLSR